MAAGSEQISQRWIEGAKRECRRCGIKITNLSKQVGEYRNVWPGPRTDLLCMSCWMGGARERLGLDSPGPGQ